ncbi:MULTISPECIES: energy transducer TonB [unclassified Shewanella]|uniref:energy transducer TonB n=1 Tax=unclassified Shewanella TaxID=196818 RepID=UPI001BC5693D|nr:MULTISPECIES: energy transducer TonB [unclassified Shewanella]GIU13361.1 cell envelope biogenesis protein TonB [Shewanella sp. MBTL60-112-B1]GIU27366.1 cell envelope biogenesis protein TonB [Shewanella sp. MBTL60-112-B2]
MLLPSNQGKTATNSDFSRQRNSAGQRLFCAAIFVSALILSPQTFASEFGDAYSAYKAAVTSKDEANIELYALKSYELGKLKFGPDSLDTAILALNAGNALIVNLPKNTFEEENEIKAKKLKLQAFELYQVSLTTYRKNYGDKAIELIDPLLGLSDAVSAKEARNYLDEALEIAEASDHAMLLADTKMAYFERLVNTPYYKPKVRDYAFDAQQSYADLLPEEAMKRVLTSFTVGNVRFAEKDYDEAEELFLGVIKQFEMLDYSHPYELAAHARLVQLYELEGESDKSTKHCIAIGDMTPWNDNIEPTPLFRKEPKYPLAYAKAGKTGSTTMSFTIDKMGFVKDPVVTDTQGGSKFKKESLKALKKWRYAPKFIDGKAVEVQGMSVKLDYWLERTRR